MTGNGDNDTPVQPQSAALCARQAQTRHRQWGRPRENHVGVRGPWSRQAAGRLMDGPYNPMKARFRAFMGPGRRRGTMNTPPLLKNTFRGYDFTSSPQFCRL